MKVTKVKQTDVPRNWLLVDGKGKSVGRLAAEAAHLLMGKHKPEYVPYHDIGDHVVVINCDQLNFTGRKWEQKTYYRHSGYVGGIKSIVAADLFAKDPGEVLRRAVKGMLPKNKLQAKRLKKLKVYAGQDHPHVAQMPVQCSERGAQVVIAEQKTQKSKASGTKKAKGTKVQETSKVLAAVDKHDSSKATTEDKG